MNEGITGATSGGVLSEMIALGAMEAFLIKGATVSFFRFRFSKHANFAMEPVPQNFNTQVGFGSDSEITLARVGDLIYYMYVVVRLPGIVAVRTPVNQLNCGFRGFQGYNTYPSLQLAPNACDGCPTQYVTPTQIEDQQYYNQYWNGCRDAFLTAEYCNRNSYPQDQPFSDTSSVQAELFNQQTNCPCPTPVPWVHWTNAVGQRIIQRASLIIGGQVIDTLWSDYLYMWSELSGKAGKRLKEMIGKRYTRQQLIQDAKQDQTFFVPLPFSFTANSGNVLPLVSLQFHGVKLNVQFAPLRSLLVTSDPSVTVLKSCDFTPIQNSDLQAYLDTLYVYLDVGERNKFATANFDQLCTQVQYFFADFRQDSCHIPIRFNHPIIEFIWAIRRKVNADTNNWFNYSGIDGRDPLVSAVLKFNNQQRFTNHPGSYFRLVQPYQFHSSIPKAHIYNYSFALDPESPQPTGSVNLSRIDNTELILQLQEGLGLQQVTVLLFGRNWNIIRFIEGVGGQLFTS